MIVICSQRSSTVILLLPILHVSEHSTQSTMPSNSAVWIVEAKSYPFKVKSAPYTPPGDDEIVVKNSAWGLNSDDYIVQDIDLFQSKYPLILGENLAGEVVEVGSAVQHIKMGDRVLGNSIGIITNKASEGAF